VAVTGLGAVSGLGIGVGAHESALFAGRRAFRPIELFDTSRHKTSIGAEVPAVESDQMTRTDAFAVMAAREAVAQAGVSCARAGVFLGSSTGGMFEAEEFFRSLRARPRRACRFGRLAAQQNSAPSEAVMRRLGATGPLETHAAACAASAMAIEAALQSVRSGEVDVAIAGGADGLCQLTYAGFNSLRAVDAAPCRPFRKDRAGLSMGEGAAILVLEPFERAHGRALAELAGAASTCDAHHMTAPHPEGQGAVVAIIAALEDAGAHPGDIGFVNAHGTGTPHNDSAEAAAITSLFGTIPITSSKSLFGHLLGASGALEAVATILCLRAGQVHPTAGDEPVDPDLGVDLVTGDPRPLGDRTCALSTSFAFGGANSALVFRRVTP